MRVIENYSQKNEKEKKVNTKNPSSHSYNVTQRENLNFIIVIALRAQEDSFQHPLSSELVNDINHNVDKTKKKKSQRNEKEIPKLQVIFTIWNVLHLLYL